VIGGNISTTYTGNNPIHQKSRLVEVFKSTSQNFNYLKKSFHCSILPLFLFYSSSSVLRIDC